MLPGDIPDVRAELARLRAEHRVALNKAAFGGLSAEENRSDDDRVSAIRHLADQLLKFDIPVKS
jgi:hypothetical protein